MKLVVAIIRPEKLNEVLEALYRAEVRGLTISRVRGHGGETEAVETYRGMTVKVELHDKVRLEIGVSDNGPGIDGELAKHVFDPLTSSKEEGLGLGLPICMSIVESHGGRVWLHSHRAGVTEFRFSLPLDQSEVR